MTDSIPKRYYHMGDFMREFNMSRSAVHYWIRFFELKFTRGWRGNGKMFLQEDFDKFRQIHNLVTVEGYTLKGAKRKLKQICYFQTAQTQR